MDYIQHFGNHSKDYFDYRPDYPNELFSFLSTLVNNHDLAWDCGTGNGQAAIHLAPYFTRVIATDINQAQLDVAPQVNNIDYHCWRADTTQIPSHTVSLTTVAQALHWFDLEAFYQEVKRVSRPDAILAAWCYSLGTISPEIDSIIQPFYNSLPWPNERRYIDEEYSTLPFPFERVQAPQFLNQKLYTLNHLIGYLNTWSAVKEHIKQFGVNPIDSIISQLKEAWGSPQHAHSMQWKIHLLIGRVKI